MKERLEFKFWLPFLLGLCVAVGMYVGYRLDEEELNSLDYDIASKAVPGRIDELLKFVDAKYVDELNQKDLSEKTIAFILDQLDPFSSYLGPTALKRYKEHISGQYLGIGIEFRYIRDTLSVFRVLPNSPAEVAGIRLGDQILSVNDTLVSGVGLERKNAESLIRDNDDNHIKLKMVDASGFSIDKILEKNNIVTSSVPSYYMLNDSIGYIKLSRFTSKSYKDFMEAFEALTESGMDDLVFDLRGNLGGVLREAIKILQQFYTENGRLILYTEGDNSSRIDYKSHGKPFFGLDKIAVLIDGHSASASEVVAGAIQDTDRGLILGEPSYGKGLVQEHYKLRNGGELRLTVARYFTPSGRLIQKQYASSTQNTDSYYSDSIYQTEGGRGVKAGGGIVPDKMVYSPIHISQILDSTDTQLVLELLFDEVKGLDIAKFDDSLYQHLASKIYDELRMMKSSKENVRINNHPEYVMRYLLSTISYIFEGEQKSTQEMNVGDPVIQAGMEYLQSDKAAIAYSEAISHE